MSCKKNTILAICILIIAFIGVFFRLYPVTITPGIKARTLAKVLVNKRVEREFSKNLNLTSTASENTNKKKIFNKALEQFTEKNSKKINSIINREKHVYKVLFKPFLLGADPFYYYYLTEKIVTNGKYSEKFRNGTYYDRLMMAPNGFWRKIEFHPYAGSFFYKISSFFYHGITLQESCAAFPIMIFLLCLIVFVLSCKLLKLENNAIIIGSLTFATIPAFIKRSFWGWYDTDPYNILFPLILFYFFLLAIKHKKNMIFPCLLALLCALYYFFWQGWLFFPIVLIIFFLWEIIVEIKNPEKLKKIIKRLSFFILFFYFFTVILITQEGFIATINDFLRITKTFALPNKILWPNMFITVGELRKLNLNEFIISSGGYILIILALLTIPLYLFFDKIKIKNYGFFYGRNARQNLKNFVADTKHACSIPQDKRYIILIYFIMFLLPSQKMERLTLFLITPMALMITLFFDIMIKNFAKRKYIRPLYNILAAVIIITCLINAHYASLGQAFIYNKVWEQSLTELKKLSSTDAIINSWWCPGHFIKAIADRKVTFDGATLEKPQGYWIASALMTDNETFALNILSVINASNFEPAEKISQITKLPFVDAMKLTHTTLQKNDINLSLFKNLNENDRTIIKNTLFPEKSNESYLLLYNELTDGPLGLYLIANWDFDKAETLKKYKRLPEKKRIEMLWEVASGQVYIGKPSFMELMPDGNYKAPNGILLDKNFNAKIEIPEEKIYGIPRKIIYKENGVLKEKIMENSTIKLSVLISEQNGKKICIAAPEKILKSVLFKLYFFDGTGLSSFKKVIDENNSILQTHIKIFKEK